MIRPKRPIALPKISMIRILTKSVGSAASANAKKDKIDFEIFCNWKNPEYDITGYKVSSLGIQK